MDWSKIRKKLETEYLAESLRGRLTYFVTCYHATHDGDEGRAAIRLDGKEILKSNYYDRMDAQWKHYYAGNGAEGGPDAWKESAYAALHDGEFYQCDFYRAFKEFDSQSIEESRISENALVRMFAVLDRRTGKRTLEKLRQPMQTEPKWLQMIYFIRLEAEKMPLFTERNQMKKGILFDLDGTLWDSSEQCIAAWNKCIREQTDRQEQFTIDDMHNFMGRTIEAIAALMFPALPEKERLHILGLCTAEEHSYLSALQGNDRPPLYPDEYAVIQALAKEYTLGIVSNCQDGYIQIYLSQCGFAEIFADIECAGRTGLSKGQNIRLVMERQGMTDCIYVGDTQGDADAAKEAGIPFIHAAYGFGKVDACDAAISSFRNLPEAAETIFEKRESK